MRSGPAALYAYRRYASAILVEVLVCGYICVDDYGRIFSIFEGYFSVCRGVGSDVEVDPAKVADRRF